MKKGLEASAPALAPTSVGEKLYWTAGSKTRGVKDQKHHEGATWIGPGCTEPFRFPKSLDRVAMTVRYSPDGSTIGYVCLRKRISPGGGVVFEYGKLPPIHLHRRLLEAPSSDGSESPVDSLSSVPSHGGRKTPTSQQVPPVLALQHQRGQFQRSASGYLTSRQPLSPVKPMTHQSKDRMGGSLRCAMADSPTSRVLERQPSSSTASLPLGQPLAIGTGHTSPPMPYQHSGSVHPACAPFPLSIKKDAGGK